MGSDPRVAACFGLGGSKGCESDVSGRDTCGADLLAGSDASRCVVELRYHALEERSLLSGVHARGFESLVLALQSIVREDQVPCPAMLRFAFGPWPCEDDVDLWRTRLAKSRPVITPLVFVQRWIGAPKALRSVDDVRHEHDQVEIVPSPSPE